MFKSKLYVSFDGVDDYALTAPLTFKGKRFEVIIFEGFRWNGANIPKMLRGIAECPMSYYMAYASCLHDALYGSKLLSRKDCDKLFYEALVSLGMSSAEALPYYLGVRAGGEVFYNDYKNATEARKFVLINV